MFCVIWVWNNDFWWSMGAQPFMVFNSNFKWVQIGLKYSSVHFKSISIKLYKYLAQLKFQESCPNQRWTKTKRNVIKSEFLNRSNQWLYQLHFLIFICSVFFFVIIWSATVLIWQENILGCFKRRNVIKPKNVRLSSES